MRNFRMVSDCILIGIIAAVITGCAATPLVGHPDKQEIDTIPMYGQPELPRTELLKKADSEFIEGAARQYDGSREKASKAWARMANDFFVKGNMDYAMRRYNQAWLLSESNYQPYWGFGQIMIMQGNFDKAIIYYEKAKSLIDDAYQKPALYTDLGLAYSRKARNENNNDARTKYFAIANEYFKESTELDKTYPNVWEGWANSLYNEGRYAESWEKIKKSRSMGRQVHPKFIERLKQAMPEPK